MPPAAKRRKRKIVEDTDSDNDDAALKTKPQNTLKDFFAVSPDTKAARSSTSARDGEDELAVSPVPPRRKATRSVSRTLPAPNTKSPSTSPAKPRGAVPKRPKTEDKVKSADIKGLFARQAQKSVADGVTTAKKKSAFEIDDLISDPISDDDEISLKKAATTSIVSRNAQKRLQQSSQTGSGVPSSAPSGSQRFMKPQKPSMPVDENAHLRPWFERFGPTNLSELAVHPRKVADVRAWLEDVLAGRTRQRLLLLKGAAGTGKTTTVQLLAKDMKCETLEWRNPAGSMGAAQGSSSASVQFEEFLGRGGKFGQLDLETESNVPPHGGSTSANIVTTDTSRRKIIVIEEFPNTFMRSSSALMSFRNNILQFLASNTPALVTFGQKPPAASVTPIVMIISETLLTTTSASADSFTAHRLLGPEILRHPATAVIEFNAVAPTLLTKALDLVVQKEARISGRRRTPGPLVLQRLGEVGDIRSAVSALEFLLVKGDADADWGRDVTFKKSKRGSKETLALTTGEEESLELITQRESSLGIFHAVGKVVYNKREECPYPAGSDEALAETMPADLAHLSRPKRSLVSVDTLIDETGTDTQTFISALHENYALSCEPSSPHSPSSSLDYLSDCIEYLSESDLLSPSWDIFFGGKGPSTSHFGKDSGSHILRQDELAFNIAVRGLLFSLPSPVKRKVAHGGKGGNAFKMYYPTSLKLWRVKEELEGLVDMWSSRILQGQDGSTRAAKGAKPLTNAAGAYRRNQTALTSNGLSHTNNPKIMKANLPAGSPAASSAPPPLLSLGSAARKEMLLERFPYMTQIARGKRCSFGTLSVRDLEKMVLFRGIGAPQTEDDLLEDLGDDALAQTETWATDKPTEEMTPRKKGLKTIIHKSQSQSQDAVATNLPIQSLVISDDDIEDDW
ncbi:Cell cycle checkpoint protein rad17 [Coniochaeta pulveracea]|uniref:Cell cycle checkpoint protein rad17 n=1 Tax=Coniochaeta pulveracea TaxID=177199 RepID=A0A420XZ02_9PEZI|nr:Cell cycle checkpoint protein rad17 [Coniochaeta pulveracea]